MWRSVNETLSNFCSSPFWDTDLTWNSSSPDFTICFEKTVLTWIPCAILWMFSPLEIYYLCRTDACKIPLNLYNLSKLIIISMLGTIALTNVARFILNDTYQYPVDIYTAVIKFVTFCLFFVLTYANIKCGVRSSGILFTFSFALAFCGMPQFYKEVKSRYNLYGWTGLSQKITDLLSYLLYYHLVLIVLLLNCFADVRPIVQIESESKNPCPENDSSFLSKLLFTWIDKFAWKGYKNPLKYDDVWDLDYEMRTAQIIKRFELEWHSALVRFQKTTDVDAENRYENEKLSGNKSDLDGNINYCGRKNFSRKQQEASILGPLFAVFGSCIIFGVVLRVCNSFLNLTNPLILNLIMTFIGNESEFLWHGCLYVFLLLVVAFLQLLFVNHHSHLLTRTGLRIRTALVSIIYKKALKISNGARKEFGLGKILNLMAVDVDRFVQGIIHIPFFCWCPLEICVSFYFLWKILGPSVLAGVTMLIILTVLNSLIISKIQKLQMKQMKYKDKRVKLTNEILSVIKVLKLYACETSFEKQVARIRSVEIKILKYVAYLQAVSCFAWTCTPFFLTFITFGVFVLSSKENELDPRVAFVSLSLFNIMKQSIRGLPLVVMKIAQVCVAMKRINKFLNSEELDPNAISRDQRPEPIVIENGEFSWENTEGSPILSDINMKVNSGDLVAVVGPVGAGKSSLLCAILGEMYKHSGIVNTTGKLAYVPQQAWIRNATLRDNITFGEMADHSFYDKVLEACALIPDLEILAGGDRTEIGEKGINLSGVQKQRISLARAVYSEADTYLLDDPLSAVDAHVGKHIFDKIIGPNGLLKEKTRIFVTHNTSYLSQVDHIIVLQNGVISKSGTYDELLKEGGDFATFLVTYLRECDEGTKVKEDVPLRELDRDYKLKTSEECGGDHLPERKQKASESKEHEKNVVVRHTLTEKEESQVGNVKWKVYVYYMRAIGPRMVIVMFVTNILYQIFSVATDFWLSVWSSDTDRETPNSRNNMAKQYIYLSVYALFGVGQAVFVMTQTTAMFRGTLKAAKYLHNRLLASVLRWPMISFDRIPSGRIMNRFSFDVDVLDNTLPANGLDLLILAAIVMSSYFVISYNTPRFLIVLLALGPIYYFIQRIYIASAKQLRRMESVSKSPIYSHFGDTITGAQSVRVYGLETKFLKMLEEKVDFNQKCSYAYISIYRWFRTRLDTLGVTIAFSAALFAVLAKDTITPAIVGLSITYILQVTADLYWWVRTVGELETNMVAVERIKEYSEMEEEAPWVSNTDEKVSKNWPNKGEITFEDFEVRYQKDLQPVLREISFTVNGCEKVGIVGRTGAGKSSLTLSLFRIIESTGGSIFIDGVDISKIGLHTLRSRLTIIPQDPVLISGTLRMNLDPAEIYSDESIWRALELVNLKTYVSALNCGLQYEVNEGGSNFSVGQRQLICLAQALLRKTRILILDEATAAVDLETDNYIQATIRTEFKDCTVLTIAHRLNTVLDYDRVLVLEKGRIAEFNSPVVLLGSKQSIFYSMAVNAGLV